jgi:hypothetical protein
MFSKFNLSQLHVFIKGYEFRIIHQLVEYFVSVKFLRLILPRVENSFLAKTPRRKRLFLNKLCQYLKLIFYTFFI